MAVGELIVRPTRIFMKKFTFTWLCLTLTTAFALAADYHLVQTQILDGGSRRNNPPTVYVMLMPDGTRPQVFQEFDSQQMEARLGSLPRGSVVHYDANGLLKPVSSAKLEAIKACCRKHGMTFVESPVN